MPQVQLTDTLTATTAASDIKNPFEAVTCRMDQAADAATAYGRKVSFTTGRAPYTWGIAGEPRPMLPGYDTGVMCLLIGAFLILAANFRHYSTFVKTFAQDLWKLRNRDNVFDDHTMSETRVNFSFTLLLCLSEGIILYSVIQHYVGRLPIFGTVVFTTLLAALFYIIQSVCYRAVGYVFTTSEYSVQWVKGFRASQLLLGIALLVPALLVLFNPGLTMIMAALAVTLYIMARIIFIIKGFRIFYNNSFSLVYFILYLCTLEILPPLVLCKAAFCTVLLFE